jgi:hypothetical protein
MCPPIAICGIITFRSSQDVIVRVHGVDDGEVQWSSKFRNGAGSMPIARPGQPESSSAAAMIFAPPPREHQSQVRRRDVALE